MSLKSGTWLFYPATTVIGTVLCGKTPSRRHVLILVCITDHSNRLENLSVISGSCLCQCVQYQIIGDITNMGYCHCHKCQKFTGSAFAPAIWIAYEQLKWILGEESLSRYQSSPGIFRYFCSRCGSSIATVAPEHHLASVCAGTLDTDPGIKPAIHIHTASRACWYDLLDDLPKHRLEP